MGGEGFLRKPQETSVIPSVGERGSMMRSNRTQSLGEEDSSERISARASKTSKRYIGNEDQVTKENVSKVSEVLSETLSEEELPLGDSVLVPLVALPRNLSPNLKNTQMQM